MDKRLPEDVERGIIALKQRLDMADASLLREVDPREGELASFDFPLPVDYLGAERTLQVGFNGFFPRYGLNLRVSPSAWLEWPHVMKDSVCLFGDRRPYSGTPEEIVNTEIDRFNLLIQHVLPTSCQQRRTEEFNREITNYWGQQLGVSPGQYVLVRTPDRFGEMLALTDNRVSNAIATTWLAPTAKELQEIEYRLTHVVSKVRAPAAAGFYLPLSSYPPLRVPDSTRVSNWLEPHIEQDAKSSLDNWLLETSSYPLRVLILRMPGNSSISTFMALTIRGACIAPKSLPRYGRRAARRMAQVASVRARPALEASRLQILDPDVVHSRNQQTGRLLSETTIVMVGVGSLGSVIAMSLARSGVGRLILIDPDKLNDVNLGRHVLGIEDLGRYKTEALRDRLHRDVPSVQVESIPNFVQVPTNVTEKALERADLVIVSTADWDSEAWLWQMKQKGTSWPLLQVWSEPHSVVGHALLSPVGSTQDGTALFTSTGQFKHAYTEWENGGDIQLPACGASFIPGGLVGLSAIAAMSSGVAIEAVTNPGARPTWHALVSGAAKHIESLGGAYVGPALPNGVEQLVSQQAWPAVGKLGVARDAA